MHIPLNRSRYHLEPLLLTWINSNYTHYTVWDEITYPFPNFNGATVEVWEWISYFIPHFTEYVITYPCWDQSESMSVKGPHGCYFCSTKETPVEGYWFASLMASSPHAAARIPKAGLVWPDLRGEDTNDFWSLYYPVKSPVLGSNKAPGTAFTYTV